MTKDEALKMAEQFGFIKYKDGIDWASNYDNQLINLITALKQPFTRDWKETIDERIARDSEFKEALEQPAQEPVALVYSMQDGYVGQMVVKGIPHKTKLYTHPHQWQGLTDDEINEVCLELFETPAVQGDLEFCYAIEAKLKEKNND